MTGVCIKLSGICTAPGLWVGADSDIWSARRPVLLACLPAGGNAPRQTLSTQWCGERASFQPAQGDRYALTWHDVRDVQSRHVPYGMPPERRPRLAVWIAFVRAAAIPPDSCVADGCRHREVDAYPRQRPAYRP